MDLIEKIRKMRKDTKAIMKAHPEINTLWWEFTGIPVDELREVARKYKGGFEYNEQSGCMVAQFSCTWDGITCFCYSVPAEVKTHFVESHAVKNV